MNTFKKLTFAAIAGLTLVGLSAPAAANVTGYTVAAHSTRVIEITAEEAFYLKVIGHDNTDLDFRVVSPVGREALKDIDSTSWTEALIDADAAGTYRLYVQNVGDETNAVLVTVR